MTNSPKQVTIEDIARLSGISKGTVDRVLHNRKGVSEKTKKKVSDVINKIGFEPNINASLLSQKKVYRIITIIPYFQKGDYWEMMYEGIMWCLKENRNIIVDVIYYNQFDVESFQNACSHTLTLDFAGVLIAPIYKKEARVFIEELSLRSIPVIFVDTKVDDCEYLAYYGMPLFESGYLAAHLIFGEQKNIKEIVNFNVDRHGAAPNEYMIKRTEGFLKYIEDHTIDCKIHDHSMMPYDFMYNIRLFDSFFNEHPQVKHIITLNSRAYIISEWMEIRGINDKKLIGFDMLEKNIEGLKKEYIDTLLSERTALHVKKSLQSLIDFIILKKKPTQKDNFFPIDILNKYNVEFYNKF